MPQNQSQTSRADFRITYHGALPTITPLNVCCREWLEHFVEIEPWQRFGPSIALEPRYVEHVAEAMIEAGLVAADEDLEEGD